MYAAWQTSIDKQENINTESIIIQQNDTLITIENKVISPENIMGLYFPVDKNKQTKLVMYGCIKNH